MGQEGCVPVMGGSTMGGLTRKSPEMHVFYFPPSNFVDRGKQLEGQCQSKGRQR